MRLIDADDFLQRLFDYAITDEQREFSRRVEDALKTQKTLEVIPIEWIKEWQKPRNGPAFYTIGSMMKAWEKVNESWKGTDCNSGERIGNDSADSTAADAERPAEDRGLCTPEGLRKDGILRIPETFGRRKGPQGNLLKNAVHEIDNILSVLEPVESLDVAREKVDHIKEILKLIGEKSDNWKQVDALAEGAAMFTKEIDAEILAATAALKTVIKNMPGIRAAAEEIFNIEDDLK